MGTTQSIKKVNYEDVQYTIKNKNNYVLINTMNKNEQQGLIFGTLPYDKEEEFINNYLKNPTIHIVIYDKNACENRPMEKYNQLIKLGFTNVYIYPGGLFEWLLLQDVYGNEFFPTINDEKDILKYKGSSLFNTMMLRN